MSDKPKLPLIEISGASLPSTKAIRQMSQDLAKALQLSQQSAAATDLQVLASQFRKSVGPHLRFAEQWNEAQRRMLPDIKAFQQSLSVKAALDAQTQQIAEQARSIANAFKDAQLATRRDIEPFRQVLDNLKAAEHMWKPAFDKLLQHRASIKALRNAGILPHISAPWGAFDPENPDAFPDVVMAHYNNNWDEVETIFTTDGIDTYDIDPSAKAAFKEALECHRHGLYRAAVLCLLPAIENEVRVSFGMDRFKPATSLHELREALATAPAKVTMGRMAAPDLFHVLDNHIFRKVKTDEALNAVLSDPIPNRHAAAHGHVIYDQRINSINMLIMADYAFCAIDSLKELMPKAA